MCGILAALGLTGDAEINRRKLLRCSRLLRHRGPDSSGVYEDPKGGRAFISFERLNIVDTSDGGRYVCVAAERDQSAVLYFLSAISDNSRHSSAFVWYALHQCAFLTWLRAPRPRRQPFQIVRPEGNLAWALYVGEDNYSFALGINVPFWLSCIPIQLLGV